MRVSTTLATRAAAAAAALATTLALAGPAQAARTPQAAQLATGDSRQVSQPVIPGTCATLTSTLATPSGRAFSSGQETTPPDTARIQSALDSCVGSGKAVVLAVSGSHNAFLAAPLTVRQGETLLISSGAALFASRNAAQYQISGKPTCGTVASKDGGCLPFLSVTGAGAAVMGTTSGSANQGRIDGRADLTLVGKSESWWQLALDAKSSGKKQNNPALVVAGANNFTLYDVDLLNSPFYNVEFRNADGFTAWGVRIDNPATAKNTDGIDPYAASNVTITNSFIQTGDDCVAVKAGNGPSKNITVTNTHCYGTHGLSIGSETNDGVTNVLMENNTLQGTDSSGTGSSSDNGIRIKSDPTRGGTVSQVSYLNTCETGIKYLMDFDPFYSTTSGSLIPVFTGITVDGLKAVNSTSGQSVLDGFDSSHKLGLTLENISLDSTKTTAQDANIQVYKTNITPSGTGVTVTSTSGSGTVPSCSFPAFPGL
ncbi:polygalacturonase [Streptomyces sp. 846.5]|nr:glycosyl hydrolase family 28 protein [Streptomyces sp. 846.5]TDT95560.1 polygalacturonase [Streptomyces sp. 846.5]